MSVTMASLRNRKVKRAPSGKGLDEKQQQQEINVFDDQNKSISDHEHEGSKRLSSFVPISSLKYGNETPYRLTPLVQVSPWRRLDVGPFAFLSMVYVLGDHLLNTKKLTTLLRDNEATADMNAMGENCVTVAFALTLLCHISLVVCAQWSVPWKVSVAFRVVSPKNQRRSTTVDNKRSSFNDADQHSTTTTTNKNNNAEKEYDVEEIRQWTHCYVQPIRSSLSPSRGGERSGIVPVQWTRDEKRAVVKFQDHVFRYCPQTLRPDADVELWQTNQDLSSHKALIQPNKSEAGVNATEFAQSSSYVEAQFLPLFYPINLPIHFYESWKGFPSISKVTEATSIYGPNETLVQLPSFLELLSEQLTAPFFLFQVFCVVLWSLDEYWYYAIFTLFALIVFESTLAYNRQQSLKRLHHAGNTNSNQRIWVRRGGSKLDSLSWTYLPKAELVPGDFVSLSVSSVDGTPVPADIVVLQGSAVCDEALLTGESVPQLKQALASTITKENGNNEESTARLDLQDNEHKESILFGGTKILVANPDPENIVDDDKDGPPGGRGVTGMVLRTGFETAQGNLLRTMAHSARTADGIHTWDTFVFILLLVGFALTAAFVVLKEGWHDERRNRFKLCLHVIIIVTSVVPPELPMELSLAVTNSVAALMQRCKVFCSELFRIPWAGEVDVCCFDKTGTLTSDEMRLRGVQLPPFDDNDAEELVLKLPLEDADFPRATIRVMIACHSLTCTGDSTNRSSRRLVVGDPLEQAVLNKTGYQLLGNKVVPSESQASGDARESMWILHRFAFSSKLKRMTVLAAEEGTGGVKIFALCKGAPETVKEFLTSESIPKNYDAVAFHHMSRGRRVLAMAIRPMSASESKNPKQVIQEGREKVERNFVFAGFLVLDCPVKPDSKSVIAELSKSGHFPVMITGDALLTAAEVARQVGIISSNSASYPVVYRIQPREASLRPEGSKSNAERRKNIMTEFECVDISGVSQERLRLSLNELPKLQKLQRGGQASFCISGDVLIRIAQSAMASDDPTSFWDGLSFSTNKEKSLLLHPTAQELLSQLVPLISVFARHAPHQKEAVVAAFNHGGHRTLMVGDGTNDVGALKRAHIGISIISAPEVEAKQRDASDTMSRLKTKMKSDSSTKAKEHRLMIKKSLRQLREAQEELDYVELGDASVAAPFTSRTVSIKCVKDVIQQGRCTLVTMLQIYKILGINCLVNAMVLSTLFLHGVKQGDRQLTILGMAVAALFFFVTKAEPLPNLSLERPPSSVLCVQALVTIVLQFAVHFLGIILATKASLMLVDPYDPSLVPDGPFCPNVLNSSTFLITCVATVNTFAVNYRGRPFMQDLTSNKLLYRSLQVSYAVLAICALQIFPPLNDLMQLTELPSGNEDEEVGITAFLATTGIVTNPSETNMVDASSLALATVLVDVVQRFGLSWFIFGLMVLDTLLAFAVEHLCRYWL